MNILVCVVIYNRIENLKRWITCWSSSHKKEGDQLVFIHNYDSQEEIKEFGTPVLNYGLETLKQDILYIPRPNIGMDIGAFQDVCRGRLILPSWEYLLWVTDDVLPVSKNFLEDYRAKIDPNKIICLEVSQEVKTHIRTTGFLINSKVASNLVFPADPITNKNQCYQFEHRSPNAFYEQVLKMGLKVEHVTPDTRKAPLWDTHNRARFNRWEEYYKEFK